MTAEYRVRRLTPPSKSDQEATGPALDILKRLGDRRSDRPTPALEAERAGRLIDAGARAPLMRFQSRPSSERVLDAHWMELAGSPISAALSDMLVADLTGFPARARGLVARSSLNRQGVRTVYVGPDIAMGWRDRVLAFEQSGPDPMLSAAYAYAEVALCHPYADGNGRLARAIFHRGLAVAGVIGGPVVPLGPLIYANHRAVIAALVTLGVDRRWRPFLDVLNGLTIRAAAFSIQVLDALRSHASEDVKAGPASPRR